MSYVFDSFFCGFEEQLDEAEGGEPGTPEHDLLHRLHVHHAEDENKLVEEKVPEIRLEVLKITQKSMSYRSECYRGIKVSSSPCLTSSHLSLACPKFSEKQFLNRLSEDNQAAVRHIYTYLKYSKIHN